MYVLKGDRFNNRVVCYDLFALGIQRVRNVRKLQTWNKRSKKVLLPASVVWLGIGTFPGALGLADPFSCRLPDSPGYG